MVSKHPAQLRRSNAPVHGNGNDNCGVWACLAAVEGLNAQSPLDGDGAHDVGGRILGKPAIRSVDIPKLAERARCLHGIGPRLKVHTLFYRR